MAKQVKIEVGDKVCVEFDDTPYTGIVDSVGAKKCFINFDDGSTEECALEDVKLISKASDIGAPIDAADTTAPPTVSPNAQQLADKANEMRKGKVDATNKAVATKEAATDAANAGKPLTAGEKEFMGQVKARLNGRDYRADGAMVKTARMTSLPSSADMTRYARLVRQEEG